MRENRYRMTVERDEDGYWLADVVNVVGCHTQARTVSQLLVRVRDALASFEGDDIADAAILVVDLIGIDDRTRQALQHYTVTRDVARVDEQRRLRDLASAARDLRARGFSLRDIGAVVGLSHGRVAQLLEQLEADGFADPRPAQRVEVAAS